MVVNDSSEESYGGHYRASGLALMGMGALAGMLGFTVTCLGLEVGFLDTSSILLIGIIFIVVGAYLVWVGDNGDE